MAQHPEGVPIAERAIFQHVKIGQEGVDFTCYIGAAYTRPDQRQPQFVGLDVRLPVAQRVGIRLAQEQRPLQRGVVAAYHREGVEAQQVARLKRARGDRVVCAVGVEPRLEPDPGIAQLASGEGAGDLGLHRVAARHRHVDLARAGADRVAHRFAADIGDARALADQRDLGRRLDHARGHAVGRDVHRLGAGQEHVQRAARGQRHVIALDPQPCARRDQARDRTPEIVPPPVGIDHVLAHRAPPGLPAVDIGRNGGAGVGRDDAAIGPPEAAIEKATVIGDVVHRTQQHRIQPAPRHDRAQTGKPRLVLRHIERQCRLGPVGPAKEIGSVLGHHPLLPGWPRKAPARDTGPAFRPISPGPRIGGSDAIAAGESPIGPTAAPVQPCLPLSRNIPGEPPARAAGAQPPAPATTSGASALDAPALQRVLVAFARIDPFRARAAALALPKRGPGLEIIHQELGSGKGVTPVW